jgi:hypothetical protein
MPACGSLASCWRGGSSRRRAWRSSPRIQSFDGRALDTLVKSWRGKWRPAQATFLLELAIAAADAGQNDVLAQTLSVGGTYALQRPTPLGANPQEDAYETLWHRAALSLLARRSSPAEQESYLRVLDKRYGGGSEALHAWSALEAATAQADGCCNLAALHELRVGTAEKLNDAIARFDRARTYPEVHSEASVRGALLLLYEDRASTALQWLDQIHDDGADQELSYWAALVRGQVLDALKRPTDAASAYQLALDGYPHAKAATVGLALDLARLGRRDDAAAAAEAATRDPYADDPWLAYDRSDTQVIIKLRDELRRANQ